MALEAVEVETTRTTDDEIVRDVQAGARARFGLLVRRHHTRIRLAVRGVLGDTADVDDAVQQAFVQAFAAISSYAGGASFATWLTRIALNEALMRARRARQATRVARLEVPPGPAESPEQAAAAREAMAHVEAAAVRLRPVHREVLQLRHVTGLSLAEIAGHLGVTEGAVKVRLHRARAALRRALVAPARPGATPQLALARGAVVANGSD
jgi:RNA polymerase sigma-70 factor (ECF subfamily)